MSADGTTSSAYSEKPAQVAEDAMAYSKLADPEEPDSPGGSRKGEETAAQLEPSSMAKPEGPATPADTQKAQDVLKVAPTEGQTGSKDNAGGLDNQFAGGSSAGEDEDTASVRSDGSNGSLYSLFNERTSPGSDRGAGEANVDLANMANVPSPRGIHNYRNGCYVISTIQALLSVKPFSDFFKLFMNPDKISMLQEIHERMQYVYSGSDAPKNRSKKWGMLRLALPDILKAKLLVS